MIEKRIEFGEYAFYAETQRVGEYKVFNVMPCENCGIECEMPNAINDVSLPWRLKVLGMRAKHPVPEICWCDALVKAVCQQCYPSAWEMG